MDRQALLTTTRGGVIHDNILCCTFGTNRDWNPTVADYGRSMTIHCPLRQTHLLAQCPLPRQRSGHVSDRLGRNRAGSGRRRRNGGFMSHSCRPRPCSGQAHKWIMYCHAQRLKMPQVPGQNGQPVVLGGGGDDDVGEAGRMTLTSGVV